MDTEQLSRPPMAGQDVEAVITAAKRRWRRRRLLSAGAAALVVVGGSLGGVLAAAGGGPGKATSQSGAGFGPGPGANAVNATVLMYPVHARPGAPQGTGLLAYVGNLRTGHLSELRIPGIINCNCGAPVVDAVGNWLVYDNASNTVSAVPANLKARPHELGATNVFAPSAARGHVWLVYSTNGPTIVRSVRVSGGPAGRPIALPANEWLIGGMSRGMLLQNNNTGVLELWTPGAAATLLPHSVHANVFSNTTHVVVYGSGCQRVLAPGAAGTAPGTTPPYACHLLRAFNVGTGTVESLPAPAGSAGWLEGSSSYTGALNAVSPDNTAMAAVELTATVGGKARLFVLPLADPDMAARAVPAANATMSAWSADGAWLFYQGADRHMWAYQLATGRARLSTMPCCQYWAMTTIPSSP